MSIDCCSRSAIGFKAEVILFCECGWLMVATEGGTYCDNPRCLLKTRLYRVGVSVEEVPLPTGIRA